MVDDILKNIPLPADLPENWTSGQIIAPTGAEAGMDDQHGYNYLMKQVNNAQKALKALAAQREEDLARIKFWASNDPTSPASFIGGTWERIKGKFIMGASDTYPEGSTGGSATKTIARTNLPNESIGVETLHSRGSEGSTFDVVSITYEQSDGSGEFSRTGQTYPLGNGTPLNILPPYYSMYIWRRVA